MWLSGAVYTLLRITSQTILLRLRESVRSESKTHLQQDQLIHWWTQDGILPDSTHEGDRLLSASEDRTLSAGHSRPLVPTTKGARIRLPRHPNVPASGDHEQIREWIASKPRPWAIDLFCGAGGLSLGLQEAGFSVLVGADNDQSALETHAHNIDGLTWSGDLSDPSDLLGCLHSWGIDHIDLLAGGPPCQPFSRAGVPKIRSLVQSGRWPDNDPRSDLWRSFFTLIDALEPSAVVLENVPEFAQVHAGSILLEFLQELSSKGFHPQYRVIEAWRHQVPQHRQRLFVIAVRRGLGVQWPETEGPRAVLRDAIGDLPLVTGGQREETLDFEPLACGLLTPWFRRDSENDKHPVIHDHVTRHVRPDDAEIFALMRPGQTYRDVPEHLRRYRADIFDDRYYRLSWDDVSRSITAHLAKDGYGFIHPSQDRTISVREAARIQTFPDSFRFAGHPTNRFRQIGNAVPPLLGRSIGLAVGNSLSAASQHSTESQTSPRGALLEWHSGVARSYAWRKVRNSWHLLLAELCLRRTRADQVASVFPDLVRLAPTPAALIENWPALSGILSHLGLSWRTDNILALATTVEEQFGGSVPTTWDELVSLPGVGDYVASATLCFAFGHPSVLLDTNTSRIARRWSGQSSLRPWQARQILYERSQPLGPDARWNYMLLDLAALVCTSKGPACTKCPVRDRCEYGMEVD